MEKEKKKEEKKKVTKKKTTTKKKVVKEVKETKDEVFETKPNNKIHISYEARVIVRFLISILLLALLLFFLVKAFRITKKEYINYRESSNIDYKVYLKDNSFYDDDYLDGGMVYIAGLIDKIHIDYNYKFDVDKESDLDIRYQIVAKLVIASQNNSNEFYVKDYDLTKEVIDEIVNKNGYYINKDIIIDYNYYNDLANDFKTHYAVNTDSRLEVTMFVSEKNKDSNEYKLDNNSKMTMIIPLSQQEVNISFKDKNLNTNKQIISNPKLIVKDGLYANLAFITFIVFILSKIPLLHTLLLPKTGKSKYDKYVDKLLRAYDRFIISIKTSPKFEDYNVIKVERFQELIDVRDNTNQPINYLVVTEHQKCEFFVINKDNLYLYVVKEADFNGDNENEKER